MGAGPNLNDDFERRLADFDQKIRGGQSRVVLAEIRGLIERRRPQRVHLLPLAQLARRAGSAPLSLQLLRPVVRPGRKLSQPATDREKCEYAAALIALGLLFEAEKLLAAVAVSKAPESLLIRAFASFGRWNYRAAIPLLEAYIALPALTPYQRLVGRVNLAAALVNERETSRAHQLLQALRGEARGQKLWLILGNTLELSAQNAVFVNRIDEANMWIEEATQLLPTLPMLDGLYVRKWRAITALLQNPEGKAQKRALIAVRDEAQKNGAWETLRDAEMFLALALRDRELLIKVYFGTPYPHYRERLLKLWKEPIELPKHLDWRIGPGSSKKVVDLGDGESLKAIGLKPNQLLAKLLKALYTDLYKPLDLASLHNLLFQETHYDPETSAARLHQLKRRLRQCVSKQGLSLLRIPGDLVGELESAILGKVFRYFQLGSFSLSDAAKRFNLPPRTMSRLLKSMIEEGELSSTGSARATRYNLVREPS